MGFDWPILWKGKSFEGLMFIIGAGFVLVGQEQLGRGLMLVGVLLYIAKTYYDIQLKEKMLKRVQRRY